MLHVVDTLRADRLGVYGHDGATSPHIDALASDAVVFERAISPAPWTLPSVVSILTSLPPCEHGVLVDGRRLGDDVATWAERLRARGYETASFYANPYAGNASGLERGFDSARLVREIDGALVSGWLRERRESGEEGHRPFFLYLHSVEPHDPYEKRADRVDGAVVPPGSAAWRARANRMLGQLRRLTRLDWSAGRPPGTTDTTEAQDRVMGLLGRIRPALLDLYDGDVRLADRHVGGVVEALRAAGLWDRTVFALTSDHGEEFGEHGGWQHDQSLYDELVHVPLLVKRPGESGPWAGRRVARPVSLLDLMPSLVDAAGQGALAREGPGASWWPALSGEADGRAGSPGAVVAVRDNRKKFYAPFERARGDRNVAWIEGRWKLVWNEEPDTVELYDTVRDPGERQDLGPVAGDRAARMSAAARAWREQCRVSERPSAGSPALDEESAERLRALGYAD